MPAPVHIAVIAGATAPVLSMITPMFINRGVITVAREAKSGQKIDSHYIGRLLDKTEARVHEQIKQTDTLWLSFWYYDFGEASRRASETWKQFFPFACQVPIPSECYKKDVRTREFIEVTLPLVEKWIAVVVTKVIGPRSSSPLLLPLRNFQSDMLDRIAWAFLDTLHTEKSEDIPAWLRKRRNSFKHGRWGPSKRGKDCFHNSKNYAFEPSDPRDPRGPLWLDGNAHSFLSAWLRFGATICRLHYDVQPPRETVKGIFYHCNDTPVDLSGGGYTYVNIFPNDYIEPGK